MPRQILRSTAFQNVPDRKKIDELNRTLRMCEVCSTSGATLNSACNNCRIINTAIQRYAESNIPIRYWRLDMNEKFRGSAILMEKFKEITDDISKSYDEGIAVCFSGPHGIGKSLVVTNVLKRAALSGYSCLYVTLSDIVANATSNNMDKFVARKELIGVDFLAIDEFDSRHMSGTEASVDLFGRSLEDIFRKRIENMLPILMCTNSLDMTDAFVGPLKQSISSLMYHVTMVPVLDKDHRKEIIKK